MTVQHHQLIILWFRSRDIQQQFMQLKANLKTSYHYWYAAGGQLMDNY